MSKYKNPKWWNAKDDTAWERAKAAFKRDWDQTKHDFGGDEPDTDQDVDDTVEQAAGKQPIPPRGVQTFEEAEPAVRLGYGARRYYGDRFPKWNEELETQLREDWQSTHSDEDPEAWERYEPAVRQGWDRPSQEADKPNPNVKPGTGNAFSPFAPGTISAHLAEKPLRLSEKS